MKNVNGGEELVLRDDSNPLVTVADWSRDGRYLAYTKQDPKTASDVWLLPLTGDPSPEPVPLVDTLASESHAQFSPDGKWLAYWSDPTGV